MFIGLVGSGWQDLRMPRSSRLGDSAPGCRSALAPAERPALGLRPRAHQPVRWRRGRVEERVADQNVVDVIDTEVRMLEQVCGLSVDLEGVLVVEEVEVKSLLPAPEDCITNEYAVR